MHAYYFKIRSGERFLRCSTRCGGPRVTRRLLLIQRGRKYKIRWTYVQRIKLLADFCHSNFQKQQLVYLYYIVVEVRVGGAFRLSFVCSLFVICSCCCRLTSKQLQFFEAMVANRRLWNNVLAGRRRWLYTWYIAKYWKFMPLAFLEHITNVTKFSKLEFCLEILWYYEIWLLLDN